MPVDKYATIVTTDQIKQNDYSLNIRRYIDTTVEEEIVDVNEVLKELKRVEHERKDVNARVNEYLKRIGYEI
jgi:type I restriction enzyme M protein